VDKDVIFVNFRALAAFWLVTTSLPLAAEGSDLQEAHITAITGDGILAKAEAAPRPVSLNDTLRERSGIMTSANSRAELTFNNQVVARLSANADVDFERRSVLELNRGAVLFQAAGARVKLRAEAVVADVSNATAVFEHQPPLYKFLVLAGTARLYRPGHFGDSVLIRPGQMIFGSTKTRLSDPVDFDISRFVKTCPLIQDFKPLPDGKSLAAACERQQGEKSRKTLIDTNLVIFGGGSTVSIVDSDKASVEAAANSVTPAAPSSKPTVEIPR
jgi:hypothetical protein